MQEAYYKMEESIPELEALIKPLEIKQRVQYVEKYKVDILDPLVQAKIRAFVNKNKHIHSQEQEEAQETFFQSLGKSE